MSYYSKKNLFLKVYFEKQSSKISNEEKLDFLELLLWRDFSLNKYRWYPLLNNSHNFIDLFFDDLYIDLICSDPNVFIGLDIQFIPSNEHSFLLNAHLNSENDKYCDGSLPLGFLNGFGHL